MKISFAGWLMLLGLGVQWGAVAAAIGAGKVMAWHFGHWNVDLPALTNLALNLCQAIVLIPIAALLTAGVIVSMFVLKAERSRLAVQLVTLCFWLLFVSIVLVAIFTPFLSVHGPLRGK